MQESYNGSLLTAKIETFAFEGDELHVVRLATGDVGVVFRRLCEVVGVDVEAQAKRLARARRGGATWATTVIMEAVAADGKIRSMEVLPRRYIPMWAAGLDLTRIKGDGVREKIAAYQDRAADVLAEVFVYRRPLANAVPEPTPALPVNVIEMQAAAHFVEAARGLLALMSPAVSSEAKDAAMAHVLAKATGAPLVPLLPALPAGEWLRPTQIAERCGVTAHAVGRAITALGLRGDEAHCKTIMDEKRGGAGQVPCYLYDAHAVDRIKAHLAEKRAA